jgi:hypothetical protein
MKPQWIYKREAPVPTKIMIPCKECWMCLNNYINDYVGRCLCEAQYSDWVLTLTLTYAPRKDLSDKVLTQRHFQTFIKLIRRRGYRVKYLVAGEYGKLRGRAHFHVILFGQGEKPEIPQRKNCHIESWPHGHVYADWNGDESALRYVCKYLLKEEKGESWFSVSKKPPLGHQYFQDRAVRFAKLGVFPRSFCYLPPGASPGREYMITGATKRDFLERMVKEWKERRPLEVGKLSEWVRNTVEKKDIADRIAIAEARPILEQLRDMMERLEENRPTERQVNRVLLDTYHDDDIR